MDTSQVFLLLCGIALFLFGMTLMGDGLKKASGARLEPILYRLSGTPLRGILLGTGVTAVLQSSCATSVMAVGFVNAGMMKVRQGIGVILGSILGTSVTGWIICLGYLDGGSALGSVLSTKTITAVFAVVGVILRLFDRKPAHRHIGDILMGFAILMLGMSTMSSAVEPLGAEPWFTRALTSMQNPIMGILVGALFTAVLQSASAAVGILQALSVTGAMGFEAAFPLLLGVTFGASAPVLLSAIGANTDGKRAALVYPLASGLGVLVCAAVFYAADAALALPTEGLVMDPFSLAAVNSVCRLVMLLLLAPMTKLIEKAVTKLVPGKAEEEAPELRLEERFIAHPALALGQSGELIRTMAERAQLSVERAVGLLQSYSDEGFEKVKKLEEEGDRYEDALGSYLLKITGQELADDQSREASMYLHVLTDLERLTDHALNIAESARELNEKHLAFSEEAARDLHVLTDAVTELTRMTVGAFVTGDRDAAERVEPLEQVVDDLCDALQSRHIERLRTGRCTLLNGFILNDLATDLERAADHCSNIAEAMLALSDEGFQPHEYTLRLREKQTPAFREAYRSYAERFAL